MDYGKKISRRLFVTCGNAPKVFDLTEKAFDQVAFLVDVQVMGNRDHASAFGRDNRSDPPRLEFSAQAIGVIGLVCNHIFSIKIGDQSFGLADVCLLPRCQDNPERIPQSVNRDMDFGGQSSPRPANCLTFGPPFPPAEC